jgi:hypothetical protein
MDHHVHKHVHLHLHPLYSTKHEKKPRKSSHLIAIAPSCAFLSVSRGRLVRVLLAQTPALAPRFLDFLSVTRHEHAIGRNKHVMWRVRRLPRSVAQTIYHRLHVAFVEAHEIDYGVYALS